MGFVRLIALTISMSAFALDSSGTYYVTELGTDIGTCGGVTAPCRTVQAVLARLSSDILGVTTINLGTGSYAGFSMEGIRIHPMYSATNRGALIIQGTAVAVVPTSGLAKGIVASCLSGGTPDPNTHASLTDTAATWTSGDAKLRGAKVCITSGAAAGECLLVEDNTKTTLTLAGYWADFHLGWSNCAAGNLYSITVNGTHITSDIALPAGPMALAGGQAQADHTAGIIISNVRGGGSAAFTGQIADRYQVLISDLDFKNPVKGAVFVESSDHIGLKFLSSGQDGVGLSSGAALYLFRDSSSFTVQNSYANCAGALSTRTPTMIAVSSTSADSNIGLFGNVMDNCRAYFGDSNQALTSSRVSVYFDGESLRNSAGDGTRTAVIQIDSAARVEVVGTKIMTNTLGDCIKLGDPRRAGYGIAAFEGGDFSGCSGSGINIAGNWMASFINVPTTSSVPNGRFGVQATNGAKVLGLSLAYNNGVTPLTGSFSQSLTFDNGPTAMTYAQLQASPGGKINNAGGGFFSWFAGDPTAAADSPAPQWVSYDYARQFKPRVLGVCSALTEFRIEADATSGGTSAHQSRLCMCSSDGSADGGTGVEVAAIRYGWAWKNMMNSHFGTATVCPD